MSQQQQPQQPQQYAGYPPPVQETSTLAVISLISGILGWLGLFGLGGLVAVITGHIAKSEIDRSLGRISGRGMANAGLILGWTNIALTVIGICLLVLLPLLGIAIFGANSYSNW
jgi:hypothetical protein